jgi:hypothetical protein
MDPFGNFKLSLGFKWTLIVIMAILLSLGMKELARFSFKDKWEKLKGSRRPSID